MKVYVFYMLEGAGEGVFVTPARNEDEAWDCLKNHFEDAEDYWDCPTIRELTETNPIYSWTVNEFYTKKEQWQ